MGNEGLVDGAEVEFLEIANLVIVTMLSFFLERSYDYSMRNMKHALCHNRKPTRSFNPLNISSRPSTVEINHRLLASLLVRHG
jgi:hypothetical protein